MENTPTLQKLFAVNFGKGSRKPHQSTIPRKHAHFLSGTAPSTDSVHLLQVATHTEKESQTMTREKTPTSPIGHNPEFGPCVYMNTTMMCSPAWLSLSHSAHAVYLAFLMQCAHERNGRLTMTLTQAKAEARVGSSATLVVALKSLQTAGLIAVTWKADGSFEPTRYRLTEYPVPAGSDLPAQAATNDWENYQGAAPHGGNRSSAQKSTCQPENRSMEQVSTGAPA